MPLMELCENWFFNFLALRLGTVLVTDQWMYSSESALFLPGINSFIIKLCLFKPVDTGSGSAVCVIHGLTAWFNSIISPTEKCLVTSHCQYFHLKKKKGHFHGLCRRLRNVMRPADAAVELSSKTHTGALLLTAAALSALRWRLSKHGRKVCRRRLPGYSTLLLICALTLQSAPRQERNCWNLEERLEHLPPAVSLSIWQTCRLVKSDLHERWRSAVGG